MIRAEYLFHNKRFADMQAKLEQQQVEYQKDKDKQKGELGAEEKALLRKQIDNFFGDPAMATFEEFYGKGTDQMKITPEQSAHQAMVLQMADQMVVGALLHKETLSNEQAMELAHLAISEPHRAAAMRSELKTKLKKREAGLTLKPGGTSKQLDGKPKNDRELEAITKVRMAKAWR